MKLWMERFTALLRRPRFWMIALAVLLVIALLVTFLAVKLSTAPAVYEYGGATLREDAYRYWFACYKYIFQIRYKNLEIPDTAAGWATKGTDGRTYEQAFRTVMDEEIRMRFVAASLFDSNGYTLSDEAYDEIEQCFTQVEDYTYGEKPYELLKERYDIGKNAIKQVALYEQKYVALYETLFADPETVYDVEYRSALAAFYEKYYARYNLIFIGDDAPSSKAVVEDAIRAGVTETRFTQMEASLSTNPVKITSGNYPHGIYLYAGESYSEAFTEELLSAFEQADTVGEVVSVRNASNTGTYYVMRYALEDAPYLLEEDAAKAAFAKLPEYAGSYLYRDMLYGEIGTVFSHGVAERYTVAGTLSCKNYNFVRLLGGG